MKVAVVTDDGQTVSQHFGRAPYYVVFTVENGEVVRQEQRAKPAHGSGEHHHEGSRQGEGAGHSHGQMLAPIGDCQALLAGGMGRPAYQSLQQAGIRPIITDVKDIGEAVNQYLGGRLVDHTERLH